MATQRKQATITKSTLNELVSDLDQDIVNSLFFSASGKAAPMQSKTKLIEKLELTGAKKKAIEDFIYPPKAKKNIIDLTANQLTNTIKDFNSQITKIQNKKKEYMDALAKKLK